MNWTGYTSPKIQILLLAIALLCLSCESPAGAISSRSDRSTRNRNALESARASIEENRKGNAKIIVVDKTGRPLTNVALKVEQKAHAFKFGCYLKLDDLSPEKWPAYERHFSRLFNYAVVGTYWDVIENKRGQENWSWFDREVEFAAKIGASVQAAPVVWGTNTAGTPAWLSNDTTELNATLRKRVATSVSRNSKVKDWEIVNEPLARTTDRFAANNAEKAYIATAFKTAKIARPDARMILNEFGVFGSLAVNNYNRDRYFDIAKGLLDSGIPVDVIGIQAHSNGEWFEPSIVAVQLARYATLGKPLQITEFSVQTEVYGGGHPQPISGNYGQGNWDDGKQAEFYREFYTVAFGEPSVEAIVTWGLDDERAWLPGIGLIDKHGTAKPAYNELEKLINNEWRTNLAGQTNSNGEFEFRGFFGDYVIKAETPLGSLKLNAALEKGVGNNWKFVV